jgi:5-methylcytosine-specific restriction endonuclease McrA
MPFKDPKKKEAYQREYDGKRYEKAAKELRERLGGKCVECGATTNLHFDHIEKKDKKFPIMYFWKLKGPEMDEELAKCRLLCQPCHIKRHAAKCGTRSKYVHHKCRCNECMLANRKYHKNRKG